MLKRGTVSYSCKEALFPGSDALNLGYRPVEAVAVPWDRADELGARLFCMPNTVKDIEDR